MGEEEATNVTAGIWGFLILFALAMACWVLYRSMSRHLRNVRLQHEADVQADGDDPRTVPSGTTTERPAPSVDRKNRRD